MAGVRFLDLAKPLVGVLPEVAPPQRKVPFNQKVMWTCVVLLMFLVMGEIPLYGIVSADGSDPLMWLRAMLASNRGTLMELGITPIVTSSMAIQLLVGAGLIEVSDDANDRNLMNVLQKFLAIIFCAGQALVSVLSGLYGVPSQLGFGISFLLVLQLLVAGLFVILLDELLQKGYGLGSGTGLFSSTNICEQALWKAFSPNTVNTGRGYEFEGALIALVHLLATRKDKYHALVEAFTRTNQPNVSQVIVTFFMFAVVIYLGILKIDLPIRSSKGQTAIGSFPIKLFYTANTPVMLQSALFSNIFLISQAVFMRWPNSIFTRILGIWDVKPHANGLSVAGGLIYFLQPPMSWYEAVHEPVKTVVYVCIVLGLCALFSITWAEISNTSARDVARQFKEQNLAIVGVRDSSTYRELKRIIPVAAALGGATIGLLTVTGDLLGCLTSGSSILLASTTIYSYVEAAQKEGVML